MGKSLIIKGANFATNAIETIDNTPSTPSTVTWNTITMVQGLLNIADTAYIGKVEASSSNYNSYRIRTANTIEVPVGKTLKLRCTNLSSDSKVLEIKAHTYSESWNIPEPPSARSGVVGAILETDGWPQPSNFTYTNNSSAVVYIAFSCKAEGSTGTSTSAIAISPSDYKMEYSIQ